MISEEDKPIYRFRWRSAVNKLGILTKWPLLYGRQCVVLVRTRMGNSCLVEFENGQREVVSRNALRRFER